MNYIKCGYSIVFMAMNCYCADSPEKKLEIPPLNLIESPLIATRDQEGSPRQRLLSKYIDLRKAIANSSPRSVESPRKNSSRDEIIAVSGRSAGDSDSPRTRLKKSQSLNFSPQRDHKTLRDVLALEEGSSPRGEKIVLALLRKTKEERGEIFREKSSVQQVDFSLSSPNPRLLIEEQKKS